MSNFVCPNFPDNQDSPETTSSCSSSTSTPTNFKLRKIPPIPVRRTHFDDTDDENEDNELSDLTKEDENNPIIQPSSLGLNHIRTQFGPSPSPLRFSSTAGRPSNLGNKNNNAANKEDHKSDVVETARLKWALPIHSASPMDIGTCWY